jgi:hypothetical protein
VEEVELRANGFEKEEPSGLTYRGKSGPENEKRGVPGSIEPGNASFSVAADLLEPELVCYLNITDIREVVTVSKRGI